MSINDVEQVLKDPSLLEDLEKQKAFCSIKPKDLFRFGEVWSNASTEIRKKIVDVLANRQHHIRTDEIGLAIYLNETEPSIKAKVIKFLDADESILAFTAVVETALRDPNKELRVAAIEILGANAYYVELEEIDDEIGEKTLETLLSLKKDPDIEIQQAALIAVSYVVNDDTNQWLKEAFNRKGNDWQEAALWAVGNNLTSEWESRVIDGLYSKAGGIRRAAIISAGSMGLESARERLIELLDEEEGSELFEDVIFALAKVGGEQVLTIFEAIIANTEDEELIEVVRDAIDEVEFSDPEAYMEKYGDLFGDDEFGDDLEDED